MQSQLTGPAHKFLCPCMWITKMALQPHGKQHIKVGVKMKSPSVLPTMLRNFLHLNNSFTPRFRTLVMLSVKTRSLVADFICCYCGHYETK